MSPTNPVKADHLTRSPRNHWRQIEHSMTELERGRAFSAWKALEAVRYSQLINTQTISDVERVISDSWSSTSTPLDLPCDYLREVPGEKSGLPMLRKIFSKRDLPRRFPYEMVLPPITGNANDFSFLGDALARPEFTGPIPDVGLRVVICISNDVDFNDLSEGLLFWKSKISKWGKISFIVFSPREFKGNPLPLQVAWHEGNPWQLQREEQMSLLAADADALLFVKPSAMTDSFLVERTKRYIALSGNTCLVLQGLDGSDSAIKNTTVMNDMELQKSWKGKNAAFRNLDHLSFAISARKFRDVGGFVPRFETEFYACRELAFRVYNTGGYFIPLAVREKNFQATVPPKSPADRALLIELSPHPWDRKTDAKFEIPKVSVYIPAYRAARYLRDAIDSVLGQDFEDLEVCIADDGSPDDTKKILESYSAEPRVRWESGLNGGIGHASNRAIRMSRGIYIGQLDSDDRLKPGAISRLVKFLDENPKVGCAYGSCERVGPDGAYIRNEYSWPKFSREKMMLTSIAHHFRMFRRQAWERTDGFREDIVNGVDYDIFLKMSEVSEFHHIDEVLYERRWHGENTSNINESFQTNNTYRVQSEALKRTGLKKYWSVHVPDTEKPRDITFRRTGNRRRVFFWPDYSRSNPYQRLLYRGAHEHGEILAGSIDSALRAAREAPEEDTSRIVFHLHWLNFIFKDATDINEATASAKSFIGKLREFKRLGGRLVWTIHNVISHDLPFHLVEKSIAKEVISLADVVHIHSEESLFEIKNHFGIPREKIHVNRHGSYLGVYPSFADRTCARRELSLKKDSQVMLFLGQIRPYKGIDILLQAFCEIAPARPQLQLVLAGSGSVEGLIEGIEPQLQDRIHVYNRFIDDMEIQIFMRSADFTVFPYHNILTSGSMLLSLSFGVPLVIPEFGMTREVLKGDNNKISNCGVLYSADEGSQGLSTALKRMLSRMDSGQGDMMSLAARELAIHQNWNNIGTMLFGDER